MPLKLSAARVDAMRAAITPIDTPERRAAYLSGRFPRADRVRNLDVRYRWDALHASGFRTADLYAEPGIDDSHIDSALRAIAPPLV